jgi:hypothetical protein
MPSYLGQGRDQNVKMLLDYYRKNSIYILKYSNIVNLSNLSRCLVQYAGEETSRLDVICPSTLNSYLTYE